MREASPENKRCIRCEENDRVCGTKIRLTFPLARTLSETILFDTPANEAEPAALTHEC